MNDWLYVARRTQAELTATLDLAERHLLVRSYYREGGSGAGTNHVGRLKAGDRLALAFAEGNELDHDIPTFQLIRPQGLGYEALTNGSEVFCFVPSDVELPPGYPVDPELKRHTALCVLQLDPDEGIPPAVAQEAYRALPNRQGALFPLAGSNANGPKPRAHLEHAASALGEARKILARSGTDGAFLGVDFSGATDPSKTMWLASAQTEAEKVRIQALHRGLTHAELCDAIRGAKPRAAVLDFPFGLSAAGSSNLGLNPRALTLSDAVALWTKVGSHEDAWAFRDRAKGSRSGQGSEENQWRMTDRARKATWAPTNLRLCSQTYRGMRDVLRNLATDFDVAPWFSVIT